MKIKVITLVVLSMLFAMPLMGATGFAADTNSTEAKIEFTEGDLEFEDGTLGSDMRNMDIDFGSHSIPTAAAIYTADDGDHTLRVSDARTVAGDWDVTVAMSEFTRSDDTAKKFDGKVMLNDGTPISVLNKNTPVTDFDVASDALEIVSQAAAIPVMSAEPGLKSDSFDVMWTQSNVLLSLDTTNAAKVELAGTGDAFYTATMNWTLVVR